MKIFTSERYNTSLYLIKTDNFIGISNMEFLSQDASLKEYHDWYAGSLKNVISVKEPEMSPQHIYISSIHEIQDIILLAQDEIEKSGKKENDVLVPFFGGVKGDSFNDLLNKLSDLESDSFWSYVQEIRKHYKDLFNEL